MILKILELTNEPFEVLKVYLDHAADCARESEKPNSAVSIQCQTVAKIFYCVKQCADY